MEFSELSENVGEWESENESESAEARIRTLRRPSTLPSFRRRPPPNTPLYVTQSQLESALARSDAKIKTVADGVGTITSRVHTLAVGARREADERKKAFDTQNKDLNQKLQLMAMLPILITPPTAGPVEDANGNVIDKVVTPDDSSLNKLLPLLLMTGMGGGGFGGTPETGGDNSMMTMALVLALAK